MKNHLNLLWLVRISPQCVPEPRPRHSDYSTSKNKPTSKTTLKVKVKVSSARLLHAFKFFWVETVTLGQKIFNWHRLRATVLFQTTSYPRCGESGSRSESLGRYILKCGPWLPECGSLMIICERRNGTGWIQPRR